MCRTALHIIVNVIYESSKNKDFVVGTLLDVGGIFNNLIPGMIVKALSKSRTI